MPSDAKKKKEQQKKEARKTKSKKSTRPNEENGNQDEDSEQVEDEQVAENGQGDSLDQLQSDDPFPELTKKLKFLALLDKQNADNRACTGVLASHPNGRDIHIHQFSLTFYGQELVTDAKLELNMGRRYGIIGLNGSGKSTILTAIAKKEIPIPDHVDIYHLSREIPATNNTAIEAVLEADEEIEKLEKEADNLAHCNDLESQERLNDIYEKLDELNSDTRETRAARILFGLGFSGQMQQKKCKDFSGGWRMRIALARALYLSPTLLLLDEPTNHLDLDASVWLEEELKKYKRILVIISHSQDFLNGVCTNIIFLNKKCLTYYTGNYDQFIQTRIELETNQAKRYQWEQDQIAHMKNYIARFGHGSAKLARQAQSKEKTLKKMVDSGLTEKVVSDKLLSFSFPECGKLPPPVLSVQNVSFKYKNDDKWIYKNLDFGFDMDTRVALVGPNGAGKSTLLKLIDGQILPTDGQIRRNTHLKIGRYHQHLAEELDLNLSAMDYMMKAFPDVKEPEEMRRIIGRYGLTGRQQICPMKNLSDGQKSRVVFAWLAHQCPHLLLLDEPTNHLDIETIDALADALNTFEGGLILVSHDFRLINQVAEEIWICDHQTITKWKSDILSYKEFLRKKIEKEQNALNKVK
uniref:ATP-binding cassette transporter subfamily F member 2 n=2 Tax=Brachionus plicatilis TaxID=10195 RepID=A0A7H9SNC6_BRAPC|nr:ATP-binding cassette transporter subfamily F member 2 [Brachionus plicatilis]